MRNHSELRDALNALPQGPFEVCRGAAGAGCGCGLVWAVTGDRVVFMAEQERPDDLIPGYSREQAKVHGAALETILNALPGLLSDLDTLQTKCAALERAEAERDEARAEAERLQDLEKTIEGVVKEVRRVEADCKERAAKTSNRNVALFVSSKASAFGFTADWLEAALSYAEIEHVLAADTRGGDELPEGL